MTVFKKWFWLEKTLSSTGKDSVRLASGPSDTALSSVVRGYAVAGRSILAYSDAADDNTEIL